MDTRSGEELRLRIKTQDCQLEASGDPLFIEFVSNGFRSILVATNRLPPPRKRRKALIASQGKEKTSLRSQSRPRERVT